MKTGEVEIARLLTTMTTEFERVSMHAVREELLDAQARALGLPCPKGRIPWPCSNEQYEAEMGRALSAADEDGGTQVVFGGLYLAEVRASLGVIRFGRQSGYAALTALKKPRLPQILDGFSL